MYPVIAVCMVVGSTAAYWNIPIFPYSCMQDYLKHKNIYPTTVRIAAPANKIGGALLEMVKAYGWDEVFLLNSLYVM